MNTLHADGEGAREQEAAAIGGRFARGGVEWPSSTACGGALRMILLEEPGASRPAAGPFIKNKNQLLFRVKC